MANQQNAAAATDASVVIDLFWAALELDADDRVLDLIAGELLEAAGSEPGVCARIRERWEITPAQCARIGTSSLVRLTPDGLFLFTSEEAEPGDVDLVIKPLGRVVGLVGPQRVEGWRLAVGPVYSTWRILGQWIGDVPEGTLYAHLPWALQTAVPPAKRN